MIFFFIIKYLILILKPKCWERIENQIVVNHSLANVICHLTNVLMFCINCSAHVLFLQIWFGIRSQGFSATRTPKFTITFMFIFMFILQRFRSPECFIGHSNHIHKFTPITWRMASKIIIMVKLPKRFFHFMVQNANTSKLPLITNVRLSDLNTSNIKLPKLGKTSTFCPFGPSTAPNLFRMLGVTWGACDLVAPCREKLGQSCKDPGRTRYGQLEQGKNLKAQLEKEGFDAEFDRAPSVVWWFFHGGSVEFFDRTSSCGQVEPFPGGPRFQCTDNIFQCIVAQAQWERKGGSKTRSKQAPGLVEGYDLPASFYCFLLYKMPLERWKDMIYLVEGYDLPIFSILQK